MDLEDDLEASAPSKSIPPTSLRTPSGNDAPPPAYASSANRDASPLPAPVPQKPMSGMPRESFEGETIFALGDEEGGESDSEDERRGLTGAGKKEG